MVQNITIFTTCNTCGYCLMVKKYLSAKGMTYEVNLDEHPTARPGLSVPAACAMTVPVTIVTKHDDSQKSLSATTARWLLPSPWYGPIPPIRAKHDVIARLVPVGGAEQRRFIPRIEDIRDPAV